MGMRHSRTSHGTYCLEYHLVLVTRRREPCMTPEMLRFLKGECARILSLSGSELIRMDGGAAYAHLLISVPPQACLANVVNSLKSSTSRLMRGRYASYLSQYFDGPYFWDRSYLVVSSGNAPDEMVKQYIEGQG